MRSPSRRCAGVLILLVMLCAALCAAVPADTPRDPQIPNKQLITPEELNHLLQAQKPLLLHVGFRAMYQQAHVPGSEYIGATSSPEGVEALRSRVRSLPKDGLIVIYCGCCPWERCPNVRPAYKELRNLGYTNVRVLYISDNFGTDWVDKGYSTVKGD